MSNFTTQLRYICEVEAGLVESTDDIKDVIEKVSTKVLGNFPIFDESYKKILCNKIIGHYYTREIAYETVNLWKFKINTRMNEIMPYYNKLYESELIKFNPMYDIDLTTEKNNSSTGTTSNTEKRDNQLISSMAQNTSSNTKNSTKRNETTTNDNISKDKFSDTPQGSVDFHAINDNAYLTNYREISDNNSKTNASNDNTMSDYTENGSTTNNQKNNSNITSKLDINNMEQYIEHITGKTASHSFSKLLKEFRSTFLNIDMLIIEELKDLFFGLYEF